MKKRQYTVVSMLLATKTLPDPQVWLIGNFTDPRLILRAIAKDFNQHINNDSFHLIKRSQYILFSDTSTMTVSFRSLVRAMRNGRVPLKKYEVPGAMYESFFSGDLG